MTTYMNLNESNLSKITEILTEAQDCIREIKAHNNIHNKTADGRSRKYCEDEIVKQSKLFSELMKRITQPVVERAIIENNAIPLCDFQVHEPINMVQLTEQLANQCFRTPQPATA